MVVADIIRRITPFVRPLACHTPPHSPKIHNRVWSEPMERASHIRPLRNYAIHAPDRSGPVASAHRAQRRHTRDLFAEKTKTCPVGANRASRPHPSVLLTSLTCTRQKRTRRKRPTCTAPPHQGLIRRKDKNVSGRSQSSEPPGSWHFADSAWLSRI